MRTRNERNARRLRGPAASLPRPCPDAGLPMCCLGAEPAVSERIETAFFFFLSGRNRKGKVKGKLYDSRLAWTVARVNRKLAGEEVGGQG